MRARAVAERGSERSVRRRRRQDFNNHADGADMFGAVASTSCGSPNGAHPQTISDFSKETRPARSRLMRSRAVKWRPSLIPFCCCCPLLTLYKDESTICAIGDLHGDANHALQAFQLCNVVDGDGRWRRLALHGNTNRRRARPRQRVAAAAVLALVAA